MRLSTIKDGNLISCFGKIDETEGGFFGASLKQTLIINHDLESNKRRISGPLALDYIFCFCETLKKYKSIRISPITQNCRNTRFYIHSIG